MARLNVTAADPMKNRVTIADCRGYQIVDGEISITEQCQLARHRNNPDFLLHIFSLLLFFLVCAGYFAVPLWDSDFWWHIASGREILQNGIPDTDPFGVFPSTDVVRNDTVLKGQWLGQVVLFSVFDAGGVNAVVAFRVLVLLTCVALIWWRCRQLNVGLLALWLVLILVGLNAGNFGGERPQLLSFLFAALFFVAIDLAEKNRWWLFALPVITVLWANSHGGVLLGVALLGLWTLLRLLDVNAGWQEKRSWLLVTGAVVLASLLTPNGLQTYLYLLDLEGSVLQARTSEYISAFQLYTLGYIWQQVWVVAFYIVALVAVVSMFQRRQWQYLASTVFLGAISASSFRYFVFFIFLCAPYIAWGVQDKLKNLPELKQNITRIAQGILLLSLFGLLIVSLLRGTMFRGGFYQEIYPVEIANFVQENNLRGRAFNNMEWGGYLLWRLTPQVTPYIDGRMLDEKRFPPYTNILWATPPGIQWFEHENFQLVMMPYRGRYDPQRYKLLDYLRAQPEWLLVYRDAKGVVFLRDDRRKNN